MGKSVSLYFSCFEEKDDKIMQECEEDNVIGIKSQKDTQYIIAKAKHK